MGFFDRFRRSEPPSPPKLGAQGSCTQPVVLEVTSRPESGGAEAWFFTLSEDGQKRLLLDCGRRGLAAVSERYPGRVAIDLERWTSHCVFFNGTRAGQREAITRFSFFADPAVAQEAARAAFDGAAQHLHAMHRAAR